MGGCEKTESDHQDPRFAQFTSSLQTKTGDLLTVSVPLPRDRPLGKKKDPQAGL